MSKTRESFYELVQSAQKGSTQSLEQLVRTFNPKVRKLIYQTTPQNREDLSQDLQLLIIEEVTSYPIDEVPRLSECRQIKQL